MLIRMPASIRIWLQTRVMHCLQRSALKISGNPGPRRRKHDLGFDVSLLVLPGHRDMASRLSIKRKQLFTLS